jgi:hypothetical protein
MALRESIGSPNRAESLAGLESSTRRRRIMALQQTSLAKRVASSRELFRVLLILVAVIALMLVATLAFGVNHPGPAYEIVPDPAGALPF